MPPALQLISQRREVEILHLHWLYGLYMNRYLTLLSWPTFVSRFLIAKRLGYRIVWTAHNVLPHRMPFPPLHLTVRRLVATRADAIITHCEFGRQELLRRFVCHGPIFVVPHGNYAGVHPISMTRAEARASFSIDMDQFVYLLLGNIAPYKGIEATVAAIHEDGDADAVVLIAGRNRAPALVEDLRRLSRSDPRIRLYVGFIPDGEMQRYLVAADVMVCSFRQVLSSGSVILGMTHGLPIIAPALGCLPELVTPEAGILYDPGEPTALGEALRKLREMDTGAMASEAKRIADTLQWDEIARRTAEIYQACLQGAG